MPEPEEEDDERIPEIQEIRDLALREFYKRLKKRPGSIDDRDLVSVLNKILQIEAGKVAPKDPLDEYLGQLGE